MFKLKGKKVITVFVHKIPLSGSMLNSQLVTVWLGVKDLYSCPIEIINKLTDRGQFQNLTGLKGVEEGTFIHHNFLHLDKYQ